MEADEILATLADLGAVQRGHFVLSSGLHSDLYVQKFRAFEHPRLTKQLGEEIAAAFPGRFDVVASPAMGAVVLGFATALAADARFVFAERTGPALALRRGFGFAPGERVLIVEDVVTTGASAGEVAVLVRAHGGELVGVGALIDRRPLAAEPPPAELHALVRLDARVWDPSECPLCAADEPVEDPGSRRLGA